MPWDNCNVKVIKLTLCWRNVLPFHNIVIKLIIVKKLLLQDEIHVPVTLYSCKKRNKLKQIRNKKRQLVLNVMFWHLRYVLVNQKCFINLNYWQNEIIMFLFCIKAINNNLVQDYVNAKPFNKGCCLGKSNINHD